MNEDMNLFETNRYRVLIYHQKQTEDLYLISCGVERGLPENIAQAEGRPGYHLHVVMSGHGYLSVNGKVERIGEGKLFVTKPGEETLYYPDVQDPWTYCWMAFDGAKAEEYVEATGFLSGVNIVANNLDPQRFLKVVLAMLEYPELNMTCEVRRLGILFEFVSLCIESGSYMADGAKRNREYSSDVYVQYALDFIHSNYSSVQVNDIAKHIGIHRSYLTNIFKKKMGVSPQEYLLQFRMKKGERLLEETDMAIQEVARRVGYDNPLTFSKMYKRVYGVSPRNYRKQEQKKDDGE